MAHSTRIPRLVEGVDILKLPIGPEEAFVLSRIDGVAQQAEIAHGTGLDEARVQRALEKLHALDAIRFVGEASRTPAAAPGREPEDPGLPSWRSTLRSPRNQDAAPDPEPAANRKSLDDATRSATDLMLQELTRRDYYERLSVARDASKKSIKAAYFNAIGRFHPDKYFGTELGEYKGKLEQVFAALTEAYDTLTRASLRSEYDARRPPPSSKAGPQSATAAAPDDVIEGRAEPAPTPAVLDSKPKRSPAFDSGARRRALARKLGGSIPPSHARPSSTLQAVTAFRPSAVRAAETVPAPAQQKGAHEFVITASRAEQGPSPSDALESLRRALAENPGDLALEQRVREAEREADLRTKARLLLDAEAATRAQRFGEAASLYGRAAAASNSAELYFKAAECSLAADDNPRRAAEFAKSGIEIAPSDARLRLLLGRIYAESGMTRSAVTELEKARQLAPDDATIEELLRRVRKG